MSNCPLCGEQISADEQDAHYKNNWCLGQSEKLIKNGRVAVIGPSFLHRFQQKTSLVLVFGEIHGRDTAREIGMRFVNLVQWYVRQGKKVAVYFEEPGVETDDGRSVSIAADPDEFTRKQFLNPYLLGSEIETGDSIGFFFMDSIKKRIPNPVVESVEIRGTAIAQKLYEHYTKLEHIERTIHPLARQTAAYLSAGFAMIAARRVAQYYGMPKKRIPQLENVLRRDFLAERDIESEPDDFTHPYLNGMLDYLAARKINSVLGVADVIMFYGGEYHSLNLAKYFMKKHGMTDLGTGKRFSACAVECVL